MILTIKSRNETEEIIDNRYDSYYWENNNEEDKEKRDENVMTINIRYHLDIMIEKMLKSIGTAIKKQAKRLFGGK